MTIMYRNERTNEWTDNHKEAVQWFNNGNNVELNRINSNTGELIKCAEWVWQNVCSMSMSERHIQCPQLMDTLLCNLNNTHGADSVHHQQTFRKMNSGPRQEVLKGRTNVLGGRSGSISATLVS